MNTRIVCSVLLVFAVSLFTQAQERRVCVKGTCFNVWSKGLEQRKAGQPVIILENGWGVDMFHWGTIWDSLAVTAPVFAYERAGVGKSDKNFRTPTIHIIATELHELLAAASVPPPYLLVGHSLGGVFIRAYAGYFPNEVSGLVFIDPADFLEKNDDWRTLMVDMGVGEKRVNEIMEARMHPKRTPIDSARYGPWSEGFLLAEIRAAEFKELNALPVPQVPILFVVGGRFELPPAQWSKDFDHPKFFIEKTNRNVKRWNNFIYSSKKGGSLIYLTNCGHFVHRDDPASTIANIRLMLRK
jgi:pimeloyl-ACP methyl ester carboxylesterase